MGITRRAFDSCLLPGVGGKSLTLPLETRDKQREYGVTKHRAPLWREQRGAAGEGHVAECPVVNMKPIVGKRGSMVWEYS